MAKKKDKPQTINNIDNLHLEIDYDKLAEAIVKAQEKSAELNATESRPAGKTGFWRAIWLILCNKETKTGNRATGVLAEVLAFAFNAISLAVLAIMCIAVYRLIEKLDWNQEVSRIVSQIVSVAFLLFLALLTSLIFRGIANEIGAEKDRNYILSFFSGIVSLAALIVALVALFRGVG